MRSFYRLILCICSLTFLAGGAFSAPPSSDEGASKTEERFIRQVVALTNAERAKLKLLPLKQNEALCDAARWLARDMADHDYFDHTDRKARSIDARLPEFGFKDYETLAENIAAGLTTPEAVVDEWMHSPGHRANILDPKLREIGVGYARNQGSKFKHYWVMDFGSLQEGYPVVINDESGETRSPKVKLTLYGEGWAKKVRFSNDGKTWTEWEPYQKLRDWTLPTEAGKHTVYVELSDGELTKHSEDTVQLLAALNKSPSASSNPSASPGAPPSTRK